MELYLFSFDLKIAFVLAFIYLFILPFIALKSKNIKKSVIVYLVIYALFLIPGVFLDVTVMSSKISFSLLITEYWANNKLVFAYFNVISLLINLFLLFPIGATLPFLLNSHNKFYKILFIGLSTSIVIEFLQFLLPIIRYPELLDVLTNTISVILGYTYYLIMEKIVVRSGSNDKLSKQKKYNSY